MYNYETMITVRVELNNLNKIYNEFYDNIDKIVLIMHHVVFQIRTSMHRIPDIQIKTAVFNIKS